MGLKIALGVHGRFHAFDLAKALLRQGHEVTVFTNYPKWAAARFGLKRENVRSFWLHGVLVRGLARFFPRSWQERAEPWAHRLFARWLARNVAQEDWDVIHHWSGVAATSLRNLQDSTLFTVMRGSAHIRTQARLLQEETVRTGVAQDKPSDWMIAREETEYREADVVITLSAFARQSFLDEGVPADKVEAVPLGAAMESFRPAPEVIEARCQRILSGQPLRVLYVGALSFQKGFYDLAQIVEKLAGAKFRFCFVGPLASEAKGHLAKLAGLVEYIPKRPQAELPQWYAKHDVFVFPTIQDGYAAVLAQATASALPVLTTTNCGGPELLRENETGWILPIRQPAAFIERLLWCEAHREELAKIVRHSYYEFQPRNFDDVAADFVSVCTQRLAEKKALGAQIRGCTLPDYYAWLEKKKARGAHGK